MNTNRNNLECMSASFSRDSVKDARCRIYPVQIVANMATISPISPNSLEICNKKENVDRIWVDNNISQSCYEEASPSNSDLSRRNQTLSADVGNISRTAAKDIFILDQRPSRVKHLSSLQEPKKFKCPLCVYKTNIKSDLGRHAKKHSKCSFTCDICKMPFMSMGMVMYHKQKHHSEQLSGMKHKYSCSLCPYGTKSKSDLNRHLRLHPLAKYICYNCQFPFSNFETLELHLKTWHSDSNSEVTPNKSTEIEMEMESTLKTNPSDHHHPFSNSDVSNKRLTEDSPSPSDKVRSQLQNTEEEENSNQNEVESSYNSRIQIKLEPEKFPCTFCSKTFEEQSMLDLHTLQFHIETQFSLRSGEQLNVGGSLIDSASIKDAAWQEPSESRQELLQCPHCNFKTSNQFLLDSHVRKHQVTLYTCPICDLPFRSIQNLMQHKLQHERQQQQQQQQVSLNLEVQKDNNNNTNPIRSYKYHCSMCAYETDHKSTFNRHVLRHSISRYTCEECQMPFMREGNLILHKKRKHSTIENNISPQVPPPFHKEQRYQCPHCQYATSYKITLQRHVKKHDIALFNCDICDMPFICEGNLSHHKRLQHGIFGSDNIRDKDLGQHNSFLHNFLSQRKLNEPNNISQSNNPTFNNSTDVVLDLTQCKPEVYNPYPVGVPEPVVCQDERSEVYNVFPALASERITLQDERTESFLCSYCPTKFTNKDDFVKHISSHEGTMYHQNYTMCNPALFRQMQLEEKLLQQQQYSNNNLTDNAAVNERSLPGTSSSNNLLTIRDVAQNTSGFISLAGNFKTEQSPNCARLNYIEIEDDNNNDSDIDNENINNNNNTNKRNNNNNQESSKSERFRRKGNIENGVITLEFDERNSFSSYSQSTIKSGANIHPKQTVTFDLGRNLVERCNKAVQCVLIPSEVSHANDSSSSSPSSLVQPPQRGRYVKLVSDFDDFAERPFACALCYHRYSKYEELKVHVQNHLTGAGGFQEIPSTALFASKTPD